MKGGKVYLSQMRKKLNEEGSQANIINTNGTMFFVKKQGGGYIIVWGGISAFGKTTFDRKARLSGLTSKC